MWLGGMALVLVLVIILSLFIGRYPSLMFLTPEQLLNDQLAQRLVWNLRLPRVLMAALLGMSLASSGAALQMMFGNPLVEPGFLGVSQGAAFGAAVSIVFLGSSAWLVQSSAIVFAFTGLMLSYLLARRTRYGGMVLRLVLAGIVVSALFSSGVGVLKYLADPMRALPDLTYWLLGSLSSVTWVQVRSVLPLVGGGLLVMYLMRWRLNLLSLDDSTSFSMGAAPGRERTILLVAAVSAVAAVISVSGIVGWIGLIVPHFARRLFGIDTRFNIPMSMLLGGTFTVICDDLARTLLAGEIPLGVLTSLLGALFFMVLLVTQNVRVQR
jgi:iron complex transport system permease protein